MKIHNFYFQEKIEKRNNLIETMTSRIQELEAKDKQREMALQEANSLLDKELTRVSTFVEDKVM